MQILCLDPNLNPPKRGSAHAAGYDIFMLYGGTLKPGETKKVGLGFATAVPEGAAALLIPRSSAGLARGGSNRGPPRFAGPAARPASRPDCLVAP